MANKHHIVIFEDAVSRSRVFKPLTYNRTSAELLSGSKSLIDRLEGHNLYIHCEPHLADLLRERYPEHKVNDVPDSDEVVLLNSRCTDPESALRELVKYESKPHIHIGNSAGEIVVNRTKTGLPDAKKEMFRNGVAADFTAHVISDIPLRSSIWNYVHHNPHAIERDALAINRSDYPQLATNPTNGLYCISAEKIYIARSARISPMVVLDAGSGSIIIEDDVIIQPNVTIVGPVFIGRNSLIKSGSKIYGGTSIGSVSKVSGEIENSIIQGYTNKQHDGYLGHSFIGEWCNLGAGTNTSDLRNDYGSVNVKIEGEQFDTGSIFVGLMMGDHSKSAIGTQFNTGTVIGVHCNIFGSGFPPKFVPSFSWGGAQRMMKHNIEKSLSVADTVMKRRGKILTDTEKVFWKQLPQS